VAGSAVEHDPPYPCPCCGYFVFAEEPGSYDICRVCGWEDDLSQLRFVTMGGANAPLPQCQHEYLNPREWEVPASAPEDLGYVRDPDWRPLNLDTETVEEPAKGRDYGLAYAEDRTVYYYWRRSADGGYVPFSAATRRYWGLMMCSRSRVTASSSGLRSWLTA
jgi:hypothetical protein